MSTPFDHRPEESTSTTTMEFTYSGDMAHMVAAQATEMLEGLFSSKMAALEKKMEEKELLLMQKLHTLAEAQNHVPIASTAQKTVPQANGRINHAASK